MRDLEESFEGGADVLDALQWDELHTSRPALTPETFAANGFKKLNRPKSAVRRREDGALAWPVGGWRSNLACPRDTVPATITLHLAIENGITTVAATPGTAPALKILLVDDDPVSRRLAGLMLERLGHGRPDTAADGRAALEAVRRQGYDLLLMDLEMPELDGLEATREIVRQLGAQRPRIVIMTAAEDDREACRAAGADDYLGKPLSQQALAAALAGARPEPPPPDDFNAAAWAELCRVFTAAGAAELVQATSADLPEQRRRRDTAMHAGDLAALRGASLQFGAEALAQLCGEAEMACAAGEKETALRLGAEALERYAALVVRLGREAQAG